MTSLQRKALVAMILCATIAAGTDVDVLRGIVLVLLGASGYFLYRDEVQP